MSERVFTVFASLQPGIGLFIRPPLDKLDALPIKRAIDASGALRR